MAKELTGHVRTSILLHRTCSSSQDLYLILLQKNLHHPSLQSRSQRHDSRRRPLASCFFLRYPIPSLAHILQLGRRGHRHQLLGHLLDRSGNGHLP